MKTVITILGLLGTALLSMALAKYLGSVPVAWGIGFITNGLFRLLDGPAVKWLSKP